MKRGIPYFLLAFTSLFLIKDSVEQRILEYQEPPVNRRGGMTT